MRPHPTPLSSRPTITRLLRVISRRRTATSQTSSRLSACVALGAAGVGLAGLQAGGPLVLHTLHCPGRRPRRPRSTVSHPPRCAPQFPSQLSYQTAGSVSADGTISASWTRPAVAPAASRALGYIDLTDTAAALIAAYSYSGNVMKSACSPAIIVHDNAFNTQRCGVVRRGWAGMSSGGNVTGAWVSLHLIPRSADPAGPTFSSRWRSVQTRHRRGPSPRYSDLKRSSGGFSRS